METTRSEMKTILDMINSELDITKEDWWIDRIAIEMIENKCKEEKPLNRDRVSVSSSDFQWPNRLEVVPRGEERGRDRQKYLKEIINQKNFHI